MGRSAAFLAKGSHGKEWCFDGKELHSREERCHGQGAVIAAGNSSAFMGGSAASGQVTHIWVKVHSNKQCTLIQMRVTCSGACWMLHKFSHTPVHCHQDQDG